MSSARAGLSAIAPKTLMHSACDDHGTFDPSSRSSPTCRSTCGSAPGNRFSLAVVATAGHYDTHRSGAVRDDDRMNARSTEQIDDADLSRLGRAADADLEFFFERNPHLEEWRGGGPPPPPPPRGAGDPRRGGGGGWGAASIASFSHPPPRPTQRP